MVLKIICCNLSRPSLGFFVTWWVPVCVQYWHGRSLTVCCRHTSTMSVLYTSQLNLIISHQADTLLPHKYCKQINWTALHQEKKPENDLLKSKHVLCTIYYYCCYVLYIIVIIIIRDVGEVAPLYGVDSALVLTNPGVQLCNLSHKPSPSLHTRPSMRSEWLHLTRGGPV